MPLADGVAHCSVVNCFGGGVITCVLLGVWAAITGAAVGGLDGVGFTVVVSVDVLGFDGGAAVGVTVDAGIMWDFCRGMDHKPLVVIWPFMIT